MTVDGALEAWLAKGDISVDSIGLGYALTDLLTRSLSP
jgi:hypothetical protein